MVARWKMPGIGGWFRILSDFKEVKFCGPVIISFYIQNKRSNS